VTDTAYHLVGVGGIGMSAIARLLLARGAHVSGSDVKRTALTDELAAEGVRIAIGHAAANGASADVVVVSSAIADDNPELRTARERGQRVVLRGAMLAELARDHTLVAVAGTHGKTTTTAMLATIFETAGLDPTVSVGGIRVDSGTNARAGASTWFVTESDESDGSFLELRPAIAVITNIENDHVTSEDGVARMRAQFDAFAETVLREGQLTIGVDDAAAAALARRSRGRVTTFATRATAQLSAVDVRYADLGSRFTVPGVGDVALNVPGEINVQNALGALAAALAAGIAFADVARALAAFHGVQRRFEIVGRGALTVVDDYAHHPTAIARTIAAARTVANGAPVVVAFQPHRYTRTQFLRHEFVAALAAADHVFLAPVYAASERPIPGVTERSIGTPLAASGTPVAYVDDVEALPEAILRDAPPGALVLMLGAGSISTVAHALGRRVAATPVTLSS